MPNPNAEVSFVVRMDLPAGRSPAEELHAARSVSVELESGRRARLDPADRRSVGFAEILDTLSQHHLPVYLEIDPETSAITRLLISDVTRVLSIEPLDEGVLRVKLARSHARHVLRRGVPDFDELESRLRDALRTGDLVILTENDAHEIIDVRYPTGLGGSEGPIKTPLARKVAEPKIPWWSFLIPWLSCASAAKAQQVFDAMNATSCDPLAVPAPCIPFLYPDDGCFARAHEMCRLMIKMGLNPGKVWIEGNLHVETNNNPFCYVSWDWHVAPTLCVRGPGFLQTQQLVIDPALFSSPVSKATWKAKQGDPNATLKDTDASIYFDADTVDVISSDMFDPNYVDTNLDLIIYRQKLKARAEDKGPPPYACPP
jgi:hypothetical protein